LDRQYDLAYPRVY